MSGPALAPKGYLTLLELRVPVLQVLLCGGSGPFVHCHSAFCRAPRSDVWSLSLNSAGITVSFASDSPYIAVDYQAADYFSPMVRD